jgi:drug/metabolite transporter (DMT)-like permease
VTIPRPIIGILFGLLAYGVYSTGDAIVKFAGHQMGTFEIGLITTLFSLIPASVSKRREERWGELLKLNRPWLVHSVGFARMLCAVFITYSFVTVPLAEVYCIAFLSPAFTTLLSVILLREEVKPERWVLIAVSFIGVLLVVRPGFKTLELGHVTALGCAIFAGLSIIGTRIISTTEKRISLAFVPGAYTLVVNLVLMAIFGFVVPRPETLALLAFAGILGGTGYLFQISALKRAPASRVAPTQYSQLIWALGYGALFFSEFPDALGLVGLGVVTFAGLSNVVIDGARTRIAGRWAEYRGKRKRPGATGYRGAGPDPV